ncbi:hypothetical protein CA606_19645 [Caulobacter vibrioides]|uniref:Lipoprotein n=1 Tax=Caulobacter vibrioides TaxID=155892 RepID=A0A2S1B7P3_CAUVI|nr:hypothetical protein [Caulobacter vibrioides]AWC68684.1 hypothetical protein CA606_19645 [Caulobacter vibrioides]
MSFQSRSVMLALSLTALGALSGCDKPPGAAKPPAEAAKPVAPAAPAATAEPLPEAPPVTAYPEFIDGRKYEANLLKSLGQPNARQDQTLTLMHNGKPGLVMTDDEDAFYLLTDVLQVPTANGVQTVYEVTTHYIGVSDEPSPAFYDARGARIESYEGYGLWRGAMFAVGYQMQVYGVGDVGRASTELRDWSTKPHRRFDFKARCLPEAWVSDTEIKGYCQRPTGLEGTVELTDERTEAVFTRVGPNAWRLRELQAPKGKVTDVENNPPTAYDETVRGVPYSGYQ